MAPSESTQPAVPRPDLILSPLSNGHSPLHPACSTDLERDDRHSTYSAIKSSMGAKKEPLSLDELSLDDIPRVNGSQDKSATQYDEVEDHDIDDALARISEGKVPAARDQRDEATTDPIALAGSQSPYTQHPAIDFDGLSWPSFGTLARMHDRDSPEDAQKRLAKLSGAVRTILECIGEDPDREGLHGTPERYAKAMMFFTRGYEENLRNVVNNAVFHEDHDELVIVRDIDVYSLCEHHLVPFTGKMHIGYIPSRRVIGLSKLARIADMFSRRLQVQERLTKQVALALSEVLQPQGVAVVMESSHLCMVMRGVEKAGAITTTSCMLGAMRKRAKTREEFLNLLNRGRASQSSTHRPLDNRNISASLAIVLATPPSPTTLAPHSITVTEVTPAMGLGRVYFYAVALFLASFLCVTHQDQKYPENGWNPKNHLGNVTNLKRKANAKSEARAREARERMLDTPVPGSRFRDLVSANTGPGDAIATTAMSSGSMSDGSDEDVNAVPIPGENQRLDKRAARCQHTSPLPLKTSQKANQTTGSPTTLQSTSLAGPLNPSSDGDEGGASKHKRSREDADVSSTMPDVLPLLSKLGDLHTRRKNTSPEKFNTGHFELLPIHTGADAGPPNKRLRYANKIEIAYDGAGTPRVASITPTLALPSSRFVPQDLQLQSTPKLANRTRTANGTFSLIQALCCENDLLLHFVSYLSIPCLIDLYSISKHFHALYNRHHTAFILSSMRTWSPNADQIYPWRCYKSLCVKDPLHKQKSQYQNASSTSKLKEQHQDLRDVPSLSWLQMVIWRQGVCKDIVIQLAVKGLRCPAGTLDTLKRLWFLMDLPLNAHRIACIRSSTYFTNTHLAHAQAFVLKLDMAFTEPAGQLSPPAPPGATATQARFANAGFVGCSLRELLLAERHLSSLWRVLRGRSWDATTPGTNTPMTRLDVLRLWLRHKYHHPPNIPEDVRQLPILDIPWWELGTAGLERSSVAFYDDLAGARRPIVNPALTSTASLFVHQQRQVLYPHQKRIILPSDRPREPLLRPEQLVVREGIRRELSLHKQWVRMMFYGFQDERGRDYRVLSERELLAWDKGKKPKDIVLPIRGAVEKASGAGEKRGENGDDEMVAA